MTMVAAGMPAGIATAEGKPGAWRHPAAIPSGADCRDMIPRPAVK